MNTPQRENPLFSIAFNVAIPSLILLKLSDDDRLGALYAFLFSLAFPFCYSIYDFAKNKKVGFIPALGFISILLTGGLRIVEGRWHLVWRSKKLLFRCFIGPGNRNFNEDPPSTWSRVCFSMLICSRLMR